MADSNLVVWTTDWHVVSDNSEGAGTGQPTTPAKAAAVVAHINNTLDALGCIDTGDNKDHYGAGTEDEHDNYLTYIGDELRWLPVNAGAGINALFPTLPGNHDEFYEGDVPHPNNDLAPFDAKFWGAPYHWTADWPAARIRFIAFHAYIHHPDTETYPDATGTFHIGEGELAWLENELATLPAQWQAIVCCHPPVSNYFGNNVHYLGSSIDMTRDPPLGLGETYIWTRAENQLLDLMAVYRTKIAAVFGGHRHANWLMTVEEGIPHITSGGLSYGAGNGYGSFVPITHDPAARTLTLDLLYAVPPYSRFAGFTPYIIQLQPNRLFFARAA